MSLVVNVLFKLTKLAAEALADKGFDVEIVERHHRFKKDSPSVLKIIVCSPTLSPVRRACIPISPAGRSPVIPSRPWRIAPPCASCTIFANCIAVPLGASFL